MKGPSRLLAVLGVALLVLALAPRCAAALTSQPVNAVPFSSIAAQSVVAPEVYELGPAPVLLDIDLDASELLLTGELWVTANVTSLRVRERIVIEDGGGLAIGVQAAPRSEPLRVECPLVRVAAGGTLSVFGSTPPATWVRLATSAFAASPTLFVDSPAIGGGGVSGWAPGDRVVVTSTDFGPEQSELHRLAALGAGPPPAPATQSPQTAALLLQAPLQYGHQGDPYTVFAGARTVTIQGEVGHLSRAITFANSAVRADRQSEVYVSGVLFEGAPSNALVANATRDEPSVWFSGTQPGSISINSNFVRDSSFLGVWGCVHVVDAAFVEVAGNVAHGFAGPCMLTTAPGTVFEDNLVVGDSRSSASAAFQLDTAQSVAVRDNVAVGARTGFLFGSAPSAAAAASTGVQFVDNTAHSNTEAGLAVDGYRPASDIVFAGLLAYKNELGVVLSDSSHLVVGRATLADNGVGLRFAGCDASGGANRLTETLIVGWTDNLGAAVTPDEMFWGRSLPRGDPRRLLGVELSGAWRLSTVSFSRFPLFDPGLGGSQPTPAALAWHQDAAACNLSPLSGVLGLAFEETPARILYAEGPGQSLDVNAAPVILDVDGSLSGTASAYVFPNLPLLLPDGGQSGPTGGGLCTLAPGLVQAQRVLVPVVCPAAGHPFVRLQVGPLLALGTVDVHVVGPGSLLAPGAGVTLSSIAWTLVPANATYDIRYDAAVKEPMETGVAFVAPNDWVFLQRWFADLGEVARIAEPGSGLPIVTARSRGLVDMATASFTSYIDHRQTYFYSKFVGTAASAAGTPTLVHEEGLPFRQACGNGVCEAGELNERDGRFCVLDCQFSRMIFPQLDYATLIGQNASRQTEFQNAVWSSLAAPPAPIPQGLLFMRAWQDRGRFVCDAFADPDVTTAIGAKVREGLVTFDFDGTRLAASADSGDGGGGGGGGSATAYIVTGLVLAAVLVVLVVVGVQHARKRPRMAQTQAASPLELETFSSFKGFGVDGDAPIDALKMDKLQLLHAISKGDIVTMCGLLDEHHVVSRPGSVASPDDTMLDMDMDNLDGYLQVLPEINGEALDAPLDAPLTVDIDPLSLDLSSPPPSAGNPISPESFLSGPDTPGNASSKAPSPGSPWPALSPPFSPEASSPPGTAVKSEGAAAGDSMQTDLVMGRSNASTTRSYLLCNATDDHGNSAATWAVYFKSRIALRLLLKHGASLQTHNDEEQTPLHIACAHGSDLDTIRVLVEGHSDLEAVDQQGATPLAYAVRQCSVEVCRLLLEAQADVHACDARGMTALMHAAILGKEALVELLLEKMTEEKLNDTDVSGWSALHWAAATGQAGCVAQLLAKKAVNVAAITQKGQTALHLAARDGELEVVEHICYDMHRTSKELLQATEVQTVSGFSAIELAREKGHADVVNFLARAQRQLANPKNKHGLDSSDSGVDGEDAMNKAVDKKEEARKAKRRQRFQQSQQRTEAMQYKVQGLELENQRLADELVRLRAEAGRLEQLLSRKVTA